MNVINLQDRVQNALNNKIELRQWVYDIHGLTSPKTQNFLNVLCSDMNVLEIGTFCGACTIPIALSASTITTIDSWEEQEVVSIEKKYQKYINKPKKVFLDNISGLDNITQIDGNIFSKGIFEKLYGCKFDIIFYDGSHQLNDIVTFIVMYESLFKDSVLVFDDYNFETVDVGIEFGLENIKLKYKEKIDMKTKGESKNDYWNGLCVIIF